MDIKGCCCNCFRCTCKCKKKKKRVREDDEESSSSSSSSSDGEVDLETLQANEGIEKRYIKHLNRLQFLTIFGFVYDFAIILSQIIHVYYITYNLLFEIPSLASFNNFQIMEGIYIFDILSRQLIDLYRHRTGNMLLFLPLQYTSFLLTLDFISIFPAERILILFGPTEKLETYTIWLGVCQLNRVFRLYRLPAFLDQLSREVEFDERFLFVIRFSYKMFLTLHLLALLMYLINLQFPLDWMLCEGWTSIDNRTTWMIHRKTKSMFQNTLIPKGHNLYLFSLYYVVTCITTTGYGDVTPVNIFEQLFVSLIIVYGAIVVRGELASHLTTFHLEIDEVRVDLFYRLNAMLEFLKSQNSHQFFNSRVRDYYQALWNCREGVSEITFDDADLPTALAEEVAIDVCRDMLAKCQLLNDLPEEFMRSFSRTVQFVLFPNGVIINTPGQHPRAMYYLVAGELVVRSRYDETTEACILSPGCVIGECLLLCDLQSICRIETKGECSMLRLRNDDLQPLLDEFLYVADKLSERVSAKFDELSQLYTIKGKELVRWVEKSTGHRSGEITPTFPVFLQFRRSSIFGTRVTDEVDLMMDMQTYVCYQNSGGKNEDPRLWRMYEDVTIPFILNSDSKLVKTLNCLVLMYIFVCAVIGPYCYAYYPMEPTDDYHVCPIFVDYYWIFLIVNIFDFWFEVFMFTNCTSWFDRLKYGLMGCGNTIRFWFDLFSFLPIDLVLRDRSPLLVRAISKLHKIFRIFSMLENTFPNKRLVILRLAKATSILIYATHFVACIYFALACPYGYSPSFDSCGNETWLDSYKLDELSPPVSGNLLRMFYPYLISFSFALATLTGVGYGDFNPKTEIEFFFCIIFMLMGLILTVLCTSSITSGFASGLRPKLVFEQRLLTIRQFMDHHHLHEGLQARVIEHYKLQHQLIGGVSLPHGISNIFHDSPDFISNDKDWLETDIFLQGIPIFSKAEASTLSRVGKALTRYLVPPEIIFLHKGEVRRHMYIVAKGSVVMLHPITHEASAVYEATAHFGLRDLLFGEPAPMTVKTLSHVLLFVLDQPVFEEICAEDKELMEAIDEELEKSKANQEKKAEKEGDAHKGDTHERSAENVLPIESWIVFNKEGESGLRHSSLETFEEAYDGTRYPRFYRHFLLRRVVHPSGKFAKWWTIFISITSMLSLIFLVWELLMGLRQPWFRILQYLIDICHLLDLYIKMHWGYYTSNNLLIYHPVKTSIRYIWDGTFLYDMLMLMPIELLACIFGSTNFLGYGDGYVWYSKLRWNRAGQIYKFFELIPISRGVFKNRITSLISLYLFTTISIAWILSGVAMHLSCPNFVRRWNGGDEYRLPACMKNSWADKNEDTPLITFTARLVASCYYVLEVMLGVGYGDMISLSIYELIFVMLLSILGFLIVQLTLADLTAAQVDSDEIRAVFKESRNAVVRILRRGNASMKFIEGVNRHFKHTWTKSKGLQPRTLFEDLHPALEADLFRDFVGDQLSKVTLFQNFTETELRTMCQYMSKQYFIKGERMSRAGNLEFQMFIIVDGEVYISNKNLEWECTLTKNEFFGEIAMLYGIPRSHNTFAATDVEVFVLDADDFATMLDRYPAVRERMIETLGNMSTEYFERKVDRMRKVGAELLNEQREIHNERIREFVKSMELFSTHITGIDDDVIYVIEEIKKPLFERFYTNIAGRGTLDEDLPFFYLATEDRKSWNFLIHPNCTFMIGLTYLYHAVFFLSPLLTMYKVIYLTNFNIIYDPTKSVDPNRSEILTEIKLSKILLFVTDFVLEGIMVLRILLSLVTPFQRDDKTYCKSFCKIAQRYLTSKQFLGDWLTTTPWHLIMYYSKFVAVSHRLCFVRLFRIVPFLKMVATRRDDLDFSSFRYKLVLSCVCFFFLTQFSAGLFFFVSCPYPGFDTCIDGGWVERGRAQARSILGDRKVELAIWNLPSRHYCRSVYWVIVTVTTTGFGDITPNTLDEVCLTVLLFLVGTFSLAVMLGNITTGLANEKKGESDYLGSIRSSLAFLKSAGLSDNIESLLLTYFDRMWHLSRGVPHATALRVLPLTMQIDATTAIYSNVLRKCKFFGRVADFSFIRAIAINVNHAFYLPGDKIVSEGEFGANLFIVFKGEIAAYVKDAETGELIYKKSYRPEEAFGKVSALFIDAPYNKTYRSEGYTEVLVLHQHDIMNISSYYQTWRDHLSALVQQRYKDLTEHANMVSIFYVSEGQKNDDLVLTFDDLMKEEQQDDPLRTDNYNDEFEELFQQTSAGVAKQQPEAQSTIQSARKPPKQSVFPKSRQ